jgi:hypothetical protein
MASIVLLTGSCSSHSSRVANLKVCIVCQFDVSASAAAKTTKDHYLRDFGKIASSLGASDLLIADTITENPSATMTFPIRVPLPVYDAWQTSPLLHRQDLQTMRQSLIDQTTMLVRNTPPTQKTAILDAIYVTRKAFENDDCKRAGQRVLVVFSDMEEDSERANFLREDLSPQRIEMLLQKEQKDAHLPDLHGVETWVAGATQDRSLGASKIREIEKFWSAYFARAGAHLTSDRYGPALLNFALPHAPTPMSLGEATEYERHTSAARTSDRDLQAQPRD